VAAARSRLAAVSVIVAALVAPAAAEPTKGAALVVEATFPRLVEFFGFGYGALWYMAGAKIVRVDAADNTVRKTLVKTASGLSRRVAFGENAVWFADAGSQRIYKVDPASAEVVLDFYVDIHGFAEHTIAVGAGSVWVVTVNDRLLERFDVTTGEPEGEIPLPDPGSAVIFEAGATWVIAPMKGALFRIDPDANAITDVIPLLPSPKTIAAGEGSIWVLSDTTAVQRIDPVTRQVIAVIDTPRRGWGDIDVGGGYVWFSLPDVFVQIDPKTNAIVTMFDGPGTGQTSEGHSIRYGGGSLWLGGLPLRRVRPP
jgi:streptogramin lyase